MYCSSGCQASVVASALAFHPPDPPLYELAYDPSQNQMKVHFSDLLAPVRPNDFLEVHVLTSKNFCKIPVFLLRHPQATEALLYSHGNASDIGAMYPVYALICRALKINVVAYDYTGYGASKAFQKKPTEKQTYIDIETVYAWIVEQKIVADVRKQLFLYGQSVGSGPSVYLAAKHVVAGLVLHSPILSGLRVITPSRSLACFDIFPNIDRIVHVSCAVFVIHGEEDMEVGLHHGQQLHQAEVYKYPPWWVPGRGHNDIMYNNEEEFLRRLFNFLEHVRRKGGAFAAQKLTISNAADVREEARTLLSVSPPDSK
eukprot:gene24686-29829_t